MSVPAHLQLGSLHWSATQGCAGPPTVLVALGLGLAVASWRAKKRMTAEVLKNFMIHAYVSKIMLTACLLNIRGSIWGNTGTGNILLLYAMPGVAYL